MKFISIFLVMLALVFFWFGETRKIYDAGNGHHITVWKTYGNKCFIIPGKYYNILPPKKGFIKTKNTAGITLYIKERAKDTIIYKSEFEVKTYNSNIAPKVVFIKADYEKVQFDSLLYKNNPKLDRDVRDDVYYINILIEEGFAINKKGKRL